jgi:hypothetical protein
MPAEATRRRFLSQAAGVAAGGTALALATVSATADAAAPMAALASSGVDPIFSLIEDYRTAAKTVAAAASEVDRREEMMIDHGLGSYPVTCVLNATSHGKPTPTMAYTHEQIDQMLPPDRFSKPNAEAHASLDAQIERHKAVTGDSERVLCAAQDAETQATPTTIAGVLALLELLPELRRARVMDDDQADTFIISVIDALDAIHPNARSANAAGLV